MNFSNKIKNIKKAIEKIKKEGESEIFKIAAKNCKNGLHSIVFYDPDEDTFKWKEWTPLTCFSHGSQQLVEVFRSNCDLIEENSWKVNDILTNEEYKQLKAAVAHKENLTDMKEIDYAVDFLDANQLELIDVCFADRLAEYLHWCDSEAHVDDTILGKLEIELEELARIIEVEKYKKL